MIIWAFFPQLIPEQIIRANEKPLSWYPFVMHSRLKIKVVLYVTESITVYGLKPNRSKTIFKQINGIEFHWKCKTLAQQCSWWLSSIFEKNSYTRPLVCFCYDFPLSKKLGSQLSNHYVNTMWGSVREEMFTVFDGNSSSIYMITIDLGIWELFFLHFG